MTKELSRNEERIEGYLRIIMKKLEISPTESNKETPARIARMLSRELFQNENKDLNELVEQMALFDNPNEFRSNNESIIVKDIPFASMCEHHWLPFMGKVSIEYIPHKTILGLSKFPRVIKFFSKKPQLQERLTKEIGTFLVNILNPKYLKVTMYDVTHTCVLVRGVESPCSTDTTYVFGCKES